MTLEEYIKKLKDFAENNIEAKYLEVVFRSDTLNDIWVCTSQINEPKIGSYSNNYSEFIQEKFFDEHLLESKDINAVCVN